MRLDELFKNLGYLAGAFGEQMREACEGVPLEELDVAGPPPRRVSLCGPGQVFVAEGEAFGIEVEPGLGAADLRFTLGNDRIGIAGGDRDTIVRLTLPAPDRLSVAGSGRITAEKVAPDSKVSIAGSGRLEVLGVDGGKLTVSIAGSGRIAIDGRADELELSIAGNGSCDGEGLTVDNAAVHIAGSGDAIFACSGEVSAHLLGSGNVIVRGSARCSVHSVGSGTVTCERERESAD
jgi:hypothetical protein